MISAAKKECLIRILTACGMLVSILLISACQSSARPVEAANGSVCDVQARPDSFVGESIELRGIYMTDIMSFSYLKDSSCKGKNLINVVDTPQVSDEGVVAFFNAVKKKCKTSGTAPFCSITAELDARATVIKDSDGTIHAILQRINGYSFLRRN